MEVDYVLPAAYAAYNLLPEVRDEVMALFASEGISWHQGKDAPTPHLRSSQVQCLNALGAMMSDPDRISATFGYLLDIASVRDLGVIDPKENGRYLTFEFTGGTDYFGESKSGVLSRGSHSTSVDAAFAYTSTSGQSGLALVEWKFTEYYPSADKKADRKFAERSKRYAEALTASDSPVRTEDIADIGVLFHEPIYQLVRQQLLADKLRRDPAVGAGVVRVVHVSPPDNRAYQRSYIHPDLRPRGASVSEVWASLLRDSSTFLSMRLGGLLRPEDHQRLVPEPLPPCSGVVDPACQLTRARSGYACQRARARECRARSRRKDARLSIRKARSRASSRVPSRPLDRHARLGHSAAMSVATVLTEGMRRAEEKGVRGVRSWHLHDDELDELLDATLDFLWSRRTAESRIAGFWISAGGVRPWWEQELGLGNEEIRGLRKLREDVYDLLEERGHIIKGPGNNVPIHVPPPNLRYHQPTAAETITITTEHGAGYGTAEHNAKVEKAAMDTVRAHFESEGWQVEDVSRDNVGWDLTARRGAVTAHLEVKGISGTRPHFLLTVNEHATAASDPDWRLAVVTLALTDPTLSIHEAGAVLSASEPHTFRVRLH